MKRTTISFQFVEFVPNDLEEGVLYISLPYATASHLCACGCGIKVVTPISPPEWQLRWDGDTVSLHPSVGNWQFPCRSHYWIRRNKIEWALPMTDREIAEGRQRDAEELDDYFNARSMTTVETTPDEAPREHESMRSRLRRWLGLH